MTEIDFYILESESDDSRLKAACRIAENGMRQRLHVFVNAGSPGEARQLDELLWTFSQGSFVPHRLLGAAAADGAVEPVVIGFDVDAPPQCELMINLAADIPEFFSRYDRVAEVVDGHPERRERGRERYRFYRDRGYALKTHRV
jgi:DNA polymerase-3 subunit chi